MICLTLIFIFSHCRKATNANAVPVLLDPIVKKSMLVHQAHVQTMAFVLIYLKDMMAIHINVYVRMVSS